MPRPKQRTPELGARVLRAALEILDRSGVPALTARGVAEEADTSVAAVYELFGDKGGLVRALFFEGFRMLGATLAELELSGDARRDLEATLVAFRGFARRHPELSDVMFSRPFAAFDPGIDEVEAGATVRRFIVARLQAGIDSGALRGDASDLAHVTLAMAQGLARQETAEWLGSPASADRRWALAVGLLFGDSS